MEKYIPILKDLIQFESVNDGEEEVARYIADLFKDYDNVETVSYTHLTLPTIAAECRSRWSPYH